MDDVFEKDICKKCKHHKLADDGVWICNNEDSECFGCATGHRDCCADFESEGGISYEWRAVSYKKG